VFDWLRSGRQPAVTTLIFIGAVDAALEAPLLTTRHRPGVRDLNRCFGPPLDDAPGITAAALLQVLHERRPEALVDLHNTSGAGPAFAVSIGDTPRHEQLALLFTRRMLVTRIRLGALMEITAPPLTAITVECGGAMDEQAHRVAAAGLENFLTRPNLYEAPPTGLEKLYHPMRLELVDNASIAYADHPRDDVDITLPFEVERLNNGVTPAGTFIGWLGQRGMLCLTSQSDREEAVLHRYFTDRGGQLVTLVDLKIFMVTTNPAIARGDCLFYYVAGT